MKMAIRTALLVLAALLVGCGSPAPANPTRPQQDTGKYTMEQTPSGWRMVDREMGIVCYQTTDALFCLRMEVAK